MNIFSNLKFLYSVPPVKLEEDKLSAEFLHYSTLMLGVADIVVAIIFVIGGEFFSARYIPMSVIMIAVVLCRYFAYNGKIKFAGHLLIFMIWGSIVSITTLRSGIDNPAFMSVIIFIPITVLLTGVRTAYIYGILDIMVIIYYVTGWPKEDGFTRFEYSPLFTAVIYIAVIIFTVILFSFTANRIQASQQRIFDLQNQLYQSQKMEALGRLAGGIAHDFNNILTAINGYNELIKIESGENKLLYYDYIKSAIKQANSITSQLLTLSKKQVMNTQLVNVNNEIEQTKSIFRTVVPENIQIKYELDEKLKAIYIDPIHLQQVLLNLVSNARDSIENTGIIDIKTKMIEGMEFRFGDIETDEQYICIMINDNGSGMSDEVLEKAFDPFFTTKEKTRGTGLGLSIVFTIITRSNGKIDIQSREGIGTSVSIYFPAVEGESNRGKENAINEIVANDTDYTILQGVTILLVEDDELLAPYLVSYLEKFGANVIFTAKSIQALEISKDKNLNIDLLITDIVLPEMDGIKLSNEIISVNHEINVILMSGYPESNLLNDFKFDLRFPFLQKPFDHSHLLGIIKKSLNIKH